MAPWGWVKARKQRKALPLIERERIMSRRYSRASTLERANSRGGIRRGRGETRHLGGVIREYGSDWVAEDIGTVRMQSKK